jgi:hypothetical protein
MTVDEGHLDNKNKTKQNKTKQNKTKGFLGNKGYMLVINKINTKSNEVNCLAP